MQPDVWGQLFATGVGYFIRLHFGPKIAVSLFKQPCRKRIDFNSRLNLTSSTGGVLSHPSFLSHMPNSNTRRWQTDTAELFKFYACCPCQRFGPTLTALRCASGFVDDVMFSYHGTSGPESSTTLCLKFARWTIDN